MKVCAATVNPVDIGNLAGKVQFASGAAAVGPPRTAGRDYAGVVVRGLEHLVGQEVWGAAGQLAVGRPGTQADYVVVPAESVRAKPAAPSFAEATAVGISSTAAWLSLSERADVQAGETVLVSGAVGRTATDIAHWRGARVIGADRKVADDLRADVVVDTSKDDLVTAVLDATSGSGVEAALDTVGGALFDPVLATLRHGGRSVVISSAGSPVASVNVLDLYRNERSVSGVSTLDLSLVKAAGILDILCHGFGSGALRAPPTVTFPLGEATAAYKKVLSGTSGTKVVLLP